MEFESNGLSREEIRKKRRKKERTQAILVLAGVVLGVCVVLGTGIAFIVKAVSGNAEKEQVAVTVSETESEADAGEDVQDEMADADTEGAGTALDNADGENEQPGADDGTLDGESTQPADDAKEQEENSAEEEQTGTAFASEQQEQDALEEMVSSQISSMSIEQKVASLFFVTPSQLMGTESAVTAVGSSFGEKMSAYPVGGVVLDQSCFTTENELKTLVSNIGTYAAAPLFIGVTDEGGEDSPFISSGISENVISSQQEIGQSLGAAGAYSAGISLGSELKQFGINVDFAPCVDISWKEGSVAQSKGFGVDATNTAELGKNVVKGLTDQKIYAAVKYFPGYGDVTQDGNSGQVVSQRTKEDLKNEYEPYLEAIDAGAKFVVVSHVSLPKVRGDKRPASLSPEIITDIIRQEWQYDGIVITDYMNKSCMYQKYTYAEAAVGAIEAGADMILAPKNFQKSYDGLLDAVKSGKISEERIDESLKRIFRVKFARKAAEMVSQDMTE